jgi:hypothetical protein
VLNRKSAGHGRQPAGRHHPGFVRDRRLCLPAAAGIIPSGSTKVVVGGMPVLLAVPPMGGTCVPTGTPMMIAFAGQTKVMAQ